MAFASSVWTVLKKAIAEVNICQENFHNSSKICKNRKTFLSLDFCHLRYIYAYTYCTYTYHGIVGLVSIDILTNHTSALNTA